MIGYLAAFLSPAAFAVTNVIDAHVSGNILKKTITVVFFASLLNGISLPFLWVFGNIGLLPLHLVPYFLITGLIGIFYLFLYYTALKKTDTSIVSALFALGRIAAPFLAYFLIAEKLGAMQYIGFTVTILFSMLLSLEKTDKLRINSGFWMMLCASVLVVTRDVLFKKVMLEMDWMNVAFYDILFKYAFLSTFFFVAKARKEIKAIFPSYRKKIKLFFVLEISDQLGNMFYIFALSKIPAVSMEAIFCVQPFFVLLYGLILYKLFGDKFKEKITKKELIRKLACFTLIGIGVYLTVAG